MYEIEPETVPETPCWVIDLAALEDNLRLLSQVQDAAHCKILLALKGFATWRTFPLVARYLSGACCSSPDEARLAREELGGEVHVYAPAFSERDFCELLPFADHLVFNSVTQWQRFREQVPQHVSPGLRINPEHREVAVELYDPCAPRSRLGVRLAEFEEDLWEGLEGLHFHTLCELGADALERTLDVVEDKFGAYLSQVRWLNFGGGHHITRKGYDVDRLVRLITRTRERYGVEVYLEPGEAIALGTGVLVASVLDVVHNGMDIAILDTSATAHMPDVLEMPYRPEIVGAGPAGERPYTYRLAGLSCLAGDVIGDYSFGEPLTVGARLTFLDMSHYTLVKTSNFNGVRLPSLAFRHPDGRVEVVRRFGHETYKDRLS